MKIRVIARISTVRMLMAELIRGAIRAMHGVMGIKRVAIMEAVWSCQSSSVDRIAKARCCSGAVLS